MQPDQPVACGPVTCRVAEWIEPCSPSCRFDGRSLDRRLWLHEKRGPVRGRRGARHVRTGPFD
ncbi:hypothetical protein L810_7159 [Burkholderia sp. AU4i]|nr:hypothetical protein L810_7159 [Burkholderia sp. AU4i]